MKRRWMAGLLSLGIVSGSLPVLGQARRVTPGVRTQPSPSRSAPARRAPVIPAVRSRGSAAPRGAARPSVPVPPAADAQKLEWARASLAALRVQASGVGAGLKLTPRQLYLENRAYLTIDNSLSVDPGGYQPILVFEPDLIKEGAASVTLRFRPTLAKAPLLVEFAFHAGPGPAPIGLVLFGSGIHQKLELPAGDHHLPAIIIPEDTNWYELTLLMDSTDKYYRLGVEYVEITPIQ
jgi:hypothetical protein